MLWLSGVGGEREGGGGGGGRKRQRDRETERETEREREREREREERERERERERESRFSDILSNRAPATDLIMASAYLEREAVWAVELPLHCQRRVCPFRMWKFLPYFIAAASYQQAQKDHTTGHKQVSRHIDGKQYRIYQDECRSTNAYINGIGAGISCTVIVMAWALQLTTLSMQQLGGGLTNQRLAHVLEDVLRALASFDCVHQALLRFQCLSVAVL